jgi:hypothetical protein
MHHWGGADVTLSNTNWVTLIEAASRLTAQFGLPGVEAVRRAVYSGEVPVRALKEDVDTIPTRIEKEIPSDMEIEIFMSSLIHVQLFRCIRWRNVEMRWPECIAYCKANLIPSSSDFEADVEKQRSQRGRKPWKIEEAKRAMKLAIHEKRISREKLMAMTGKELAHEFNVGRTTPTAARRAALE